MFLKKNICKKKTKQLHCGYLKYLVFLFIGLEERTRDQTGGREIVKKIKNSRQGVLPTIEILFLTEFVSF